MQTTTPHIISNIRLNDDPTPRHYTAEICTLTKQGEKKTYTAVVQEFQLLYAGTQGEFRHYQMNIKDRFYLNERYNIIQKLNKAQKLGLTIAKINDHLEFATNPHFKFIKITNPQTIRDTWQTVRPEILEMHPDLNTMAANFDQQLKDENIQRLYQNDNFFNFFFADIFQQKIKKGEELETNKIVADAIERIAIPIIEIRKVVTSDDPETQITVNLSAEMDADHSKFPLNELTAFLGKLPATPGSQQALRLKYSGVYQVDTDKGIITQGSLNYTFSIGEFYEKTTIINYTVA